MPGTSGLVGHHRILWWTSLFLMLGAGFATFNVPCSAQQKPTSVSNEKAAIALNKDGIASAATGDYATANEKFRHACDLWPGFADARYNLAVTLERAGQL